MNPLTLKPKKESKKKSKCLILRERMGISQRDLSSYLGVSQALINRWERPYGKVPTKWLLAMENIASQLENDRKPKKYDFIITHEMTLLPESIYEISPSRFYHGKDINWLLGRDGMTRYILASYLKCNKSTISKWISNPEDKIHYKYTKLIESLYKDIKSGKIKI